MPLQLLSSCLSVSSSGRSAPPRCRSSPRVAPLPQTDRRFEQWLLQRGLPSQPLRLERVLNQGRGLLASERIGSRTTLLQVRRH